MLQTPKPPSPYAENPWVEAHLAREERMQDGVDPKKWAPEILAMYAGFEQPVGQCPCGDLLWYRANTGGHKCPSCGAYADASGQILGVTPIKEKVDA
jgi:hypothetical protein